MRTSMVTAVAALFLGTAVQGQEIVEVPASKAGVVLPDDIFSLPPGSWFISRQVSQTDDPCTPEACEAGFNSGDFVISVEHSQEFVRVIAGFRGCQGVAFQEVETGMRPGSYVRGEVSNAMKYVVKGAEKTCGTKAPSMPKLDVRSLFPRPSQ